MAVAIFIFTARSLSFIFLCRCVCVGGGVGVCVGVGGCVGVCVCKFIYLSFIVKLESTRLVSPKLSNLYPSLVTKLRLISHMYMSFWDLTYI